PIALVEDGDIIEIDAASGTIELEVDEATLEKRRASWRPRETMYASGALWKYAQLVGPARNGAITHPGAKAEKHVYADI
ncbi:MAG TPA: dihydroxy-acid dehydratase, partial [Rhodobiaceae bacterium]|nr:dihydroxy-acid dehydratase [Rhodobiaceae bacterium]